MGPGLELAGRRLGGDLLLELPGQICRNLSIKVHGINPVWGSAWGAAREQIFKTRVLERFCPKNAPG